VWSGVGVFYGGARSERCTRSEHFNAEAVNSVASTTSSCIDVQIGAAEYSSSLPLSAGTHQREPLTSASRRPPTDNPLRLESNYPSTSHALSSVV